MSKNIRQKKLISIPTFSLYGEDRGQGPELLHVEDVESRSHLYQWEIEPHIHKGLYQVLWIHHGEATVSLDEHSQSLAGPAVIVVPPSVVHGFTFASNTDGLVLTISTGFMLYNGFQQVGEAFGNLFDSPTIITLGDDLQLASRLHLLMRNLLEEFSSPFSSDSPLPLWLANAIIWRLASIRNTKQKSINKNSTRQQAYFNRFLLLIEEHFVEHWSLSRYASRIGMSTPRLNRLTIDSANCSAMELVHRRLTREACRRLIYVPEPLGNLAFDLGFEDPGYFSRFFKRRMGVTPMQYRNDHSNKSVG